VSEGARYRRRYESFPFINDVRLLFCLQSDINRALRDDVLRSCAMPSIRRASDAETESFSHSFAAGEKRQIDLSTLPRAEEGEAHNRETTPTRPFRLELGRRW
jgi:hypothetical protein